jgi:hypothetical protein
MMEPIPPADMPLSAGSEEPCIFQEQICGTQGRIQALQDMQAIVD